LLRGLLTADQATMDGVTRLMRPGAVLSLLVSVAARDGGVGVQPIWDGTLHRLAEAYDNHGLTVTQARLATVADVTAAHSTWGKRLGVGVKRQAWQITATRQPHPARGDATAGLRGS
jgi:16S rRNA (adenine(1408)-N(1))-methyltransferase